MVAVVGWTCRGGDVGRAEGVREGPKRGAADDVTPTVQRAVDVGVIAVELCDVGAGVATIV